MGVKQSQLVLEWQAEAREEGRRDGLLAARRESVLRALKLRLKKKVPRKLASAIEALRDMDELSRWFDVSLTVDSLDVFRAAVQQ